MRRMRATNRLAVQARSLHKPTPRPHDGKGWYSIVNLEGDSEDTSSTEVYIYDEIGLWGVTAADFVRELQWVEAEHINLHINSPGGDVWDGITIYNSLCNHPALVTTYIDGIAASSASFIAQAGARVLIARNGTMMIHDAEGICIGNSADMMEIAELLDRTSNNIADIYAQRCSRISVWRKAMKDVTWYVGQEAVNGGLADATYEPDQGTQDEPVGRRHRTKNKSRDSGVGSTDNGVGNNRVPRAVSSAAPNHETDSTEDGAWDADTETGRLNFPITVATANRVYAWYDSSRVEDGKVPQDACSLPHHVVGEDGTPGAAHIASVNDALSQLSQSDIPEDDRSAIREHLNAHLDSVDSGEQEQEPEDLSAWWNPDVFKTALATAADQHNLYGFDPQLFKECVRAAAENCPAPQDEEQVQVTPEPVVTIDQREFVEALRKGLL